MTNLKNELQNELQRAIRRKVIISRVRVKINKWLVTDLHYDETSEYKTKTEAEQVAKEANRESVKVQRAYKNKFKVVDTHYSTTKVYASLASAKRAIKRDDDRRASANIPTITTLKINL